MATICGIYKITNNVNGKMYVGQSRNIRKRWNLHKSRAQFPLHHKSALYAAIRQYGIDNFIMDIVEECTIDKLNTLEIFWITHLRTMSPTGYNLDSGGNCPTVISDEWKLKNSLAQIGRKQSPETIRKRVLAILGRKDTPEQIARKVAARKLVPISSRIKISNSLKGHEVSQHVRDKISEKLKGVCTYEHSRAVVRSDGTSFTSIKEAARCSNALQANVWKVLNGVRKSAGGYSFTYMGD